MTFPDITSMLSWWQWAILGVVPPAIVALYFLKLKRRPLEVPSTWLWHKSIEDLHVNAIWQRLRRNLLLLLQLLLILLAVLALLRPSWQAMKLTGKRFVFLIDNSASMQATDVSPSRLEEAKRKAIELVDQMGSGETGMVVSFNDTAQMEQMFTDDRRRLREAIEAIRPTPRSTSLLDALKVAAARVNPTQSGEQSDVDVAETKLFIFSDGKFAPPVFKLGNLEPVFVPIGRPDAANVGIVAFSIGRDELKPDRLQAFARLENFGPQPATVALELSLDGRQIDSDQSEIGPGKSRGVAFDLGKAEAGVLRLAAKTGDHLALDDEAWAVLSLPRPAKVLLVTPGYYWLERALATKAAANAAEIRTERPDFLKTKTYADQAAAGAFDLVIYDRCAPAQMPRANTLLIGTLPPPPQPVGTKPVGTKAPAAGWSAGAKVSGPQIIDTQVSHPLMQWLDFSDVLVAEGTPVRAPPGGSVLIDSTAGPLMALAPREGFEDAVLGFALIREAPGGDGKPVQYVNTDWHKRLSFATFFLNVINYMGGARQRQDAGSVRLGSTVTLDAPDPQATIQVRTPGGQTVSLRAGPSGRFSFANTGELGIYEARTGGKTPGRFAVNLFDAAESDIRPGSDPMIKIGFTEVKGHAGWQTARREIWKGLVLLGLAVLLLEWYIYYRRVYL